MEPPKVRDVLVGQEQYAPDTAAVWAAVSAATTRRQLTRRRFVIGGVAAGVVAIATGTTLTQRSRDRTALPKPAPTMPTGTTSASADRSVTTFAATTADTTQPVSPAASAAVLARGHWTSLPAAPIPPRKYPTGAWTRREMLVWGGEADDDTLLTDGAAYDPDSRRWRVLTPAPAGARSRWAGIWTGTSLVLWGVAMDGEDTSPTGAQYDPTTDRWQMLPTSPMGASSASHAVWAGSRLVALAVPSGPDPQRIDAASYDPVADAWSSLPPVDLPAGHPVLDFQVAAADSTVYVWSRWQHSTTTNSQSGTEVSSTAGTDCFRLEDGTWRPVSFTGGSGVNGGAPIWTGTVFVQPAGYNWSGFHSQPAAQGLTGRVLNPKTGQVTDIAHGPVDDLGPRSIWTGSALVCFDTGTYTSGAGHTDYPGEAAVWNPKTDVWTTLPAPGLASADGAAAVWTGSSLLMWGRFYRAKTADSPAPADVFAAGLQFTATPPISAPTSR